MEGWIKLHRKLISNRLWLDEPFTRGQAWVDLLLLANHRDTFFYKRGNKISVSRGQVGRSVVELADRWKWSRTKVNKYLKDLEKEQQIIQQKNNVTTLITIVNWSDYQEKEQRTVQQSGQQKSSRSAAEVQQKNTYKNVKNDNNVKNEKEKDNDGPDRQSVRDYFRSHGYKVSIADKAYDYYEALNWHDKDGKPVKNWKGKMVKVWFNEEHKDPTLNSEGKPKLSA